MKTRDFKSGIENVSEYCKSTVGKIVKLSVNDQVMIQRLLAESNIAVNKIQEDSEIDTTSLDTLLQFLDSITTLKTESTDDFLSKFKQDIVRPGKIDLDVKEKIISKF